MTAPRWDAAQLALALLSIDPVGLGGIVVRARVGPVRDAFLAELGSIHLPCRRIHPDISDEALFGGLDLSATLTAQKVVFSRGLMYEPAAIVLTMAERTAPTLAAKLAQAIDDIPHFTLVALDEGTDADERCPPALSERTAFRADLDGIGRMQTPPSDLPDPAVARALYPRVPATSQAIEALTALAARYGVDSLRAPLFALRAARAHAALFGRVSLVSDDIAAAAGLVYGHRATQMPTDEDEPQDDPPPPPDQDEADSPQGQDDDILDIPPEMLIEAVRAMLPEGMLETLVPAGTARGARGSGAGARRKGNRRGRPLPSRPGRLDGRARIDLVATLRAAAPWQPLRRKLSARKHRLLIHPSDIHVKRYEDRSDRLLIFTVDASGSAALARLAEAKGAVELLLAQAYARRDHVALIAFRGDGAQLLLPPTRSLVQTKRRLAALPGGGGTPLAAGLQAAGELADHARGHGLSPAIAVLTDGRANIALDGRADRVRAAEDAVRLGRWLRGSGVPGVVLDMGNRPARQLAELAAQMGARYLPMPRADAGRLSAAVGAALDG
ncbi:magnesium chelatase subunit D [Lutimaribacter sp. EGI FJ00015]|uniref:Magnesium chelatase subunit D n=1 Tax=Lutimaribacter degradans TaxID=2945989 RepID=A0ACC5ZW84_9RHOB|nr:magnesium chelatase subunit D [Lutimaribacter sp. EGI FJ00013]MCM2562026.1 magnesium chelatase subunit D [Lutimaribacter sp. EGI FJ00013]MCO0612942.1 magnesium chelatase subunit D [Lutimaribacter sp. EGI FJ00015]MCO0635858.1 magnesium chelatase subunit D [Lutimaribacter sp. EGI FJ00014]